MKKNENSCSEIKTKPTHDDIHVVTKSKCVHEWIQDYIDIDPDYSQIIFYCKFCEITKNPSS